MGSAISSTSRIWKIVLAWAFLLTGLQPLQAEEDKTLSPYFLVVSDDPSLDQLPLKAVTAEVDVAGVIADVRITQVYQNEGTRPLEAIYVFPASTRAAVYGMEMRIGDRRIVAEVREREQARQEYEEAKEEGKSASLLEQQRPNVFQMSVANIMPGDTIRVELRYTELLVPTDGMYEFVYPTVVGPRYSEKTEASADPGDEFLGTPYQHEGAPPVYAFDIQVDLATGLPIQELVCRSHQVETEGEGTPWAHVGLAADEREGGNRDFILQYRLTGNRIESGLLLYEGEEENFFLLMAQPPQRVLLEQVPPREYVFVVDVSGSMRGFPLDVSKALLRDLIGHLRPDDFFNVVLFAGRSAVMAPESLPATAENIGRAIDVIDNQSGGGGTRIMLALERALSLPRQAQGLSRTVVVATDGFVAVEVETFELIRRHLNEMNVFAFGIGSSVNRHIIEGMARAGMGEPFVVTDQADAEIQAGQFEKYIRTPVLTQIEMEMDGFEGYEVEPPHIPDIMAERPVIVFGKWQGEPEGTISLRGFAGETTFDSQVDVGAAVPLESNAALRYLWARHRIALLGDYHNIRQDEATQKEITELGLRYNLLTQFTSFVAIDQVVRNDSTITTVRQPLPLPEGVSDDAVGGGMTASAIEEELSTVAWLGKEFVWRDGKWIDLAFQPGMPMEEYDPSAAQPVELALFARLDQRMVVVVGERAYELRRGVLPVRPVLLPNAPNPFNAATVIRFQIPAGREHEPVELVVFNLSGQLVRVLAEGTFAVGERRLVWDGRDERGADLASGVYLCRLRMGDQEACRRMLLLR